LFSSTEAKKKHGKAGFDNVCDALLPVDNAIYI
jgi:hypothetical protein